MTVTVYTRPSCVQCVATFRQFKKHGFEVEEADLEAHPDVLEYAREKGIGAAPVVLVRESGQPRDAWGGYRPDKIKEVAHAG